jgi:mannitol/fructose-specific phosphotransferase system IIA component (Ntr-type)
MDLATILTPDSVRVPLSAVEKQEAICELVDVLHTAGRLTNRDAILSAILAREATRSTGIGGGLAVPHGKSDGCDTLVMAVGKPVEPIPFDSIDGEPVTLVVLLASPPQEAGPHIQALARISRMMLEPRTRKALAEAPDAQALYTVLTAGPQED